MTRDKTTDEILTDTNPYAALFEKIWERSRRGIPAQFAAFPCYSISIECTGNRWALCLMPNGKSVQGTIMADIHGQSFMVGIHDMILPIKCWDEEEGEDYLIGEPNTANYTLQQTSFSRILPMINVFRRWVDRGERLACLDVLRASVESIQIKSGQNPSELLSDLKGACAIPYPPLPNQALFVRMRLNRYPYDMLF